MQPRSKVVSINDKKFEVRRLAPEVGTFILMRMLGISMRSAAEREPATQHSAKQESFAATEETQEPTVGVGEMRVRALSFAVMSGGISFEDFRFIQSACMKCVAKIENRAGVDFPLPIVDDKGVWTPDGVDVANDVGALTRLTTEVLILCFADFFDASVLGT